MNQKLHNIAIYSIQQKGSNGAKLWSKIIEINPCNNQDRKMPNEISEQTSTTSKIRNQNLKRWLQFQSYGSKKAALIHPLL